MTTADLPLLLPGRLVSEILEHLDTCDNVTAVLDEPTDDTSPDLGDQLYDQARAEGGVLFDWFTDVFESAYYNGETTGAPTAAGGSSPADV